MIRVINLILLLVGILFSQESSTFRFGIKGGINFSYITGAKKYYDSNLNKPYRKYGFNLGVISDKKIDSMFTLQYEVLYNETGSKWGQPLFGFGYDGDYAFYELKYITFSAVGKFKSRIGNLIKDFDFVLGLAYSYNISARQKWVVERVSSYQLDLGPSNIRPQINPHEFGITYGIKIPFKNRKEYLSILFYNAINTLYLRPIYYTDDFTNKDDMRNNSLSICFDRFF